MPEERGYGDGIVISTCRVISAEPKFVSFAGDRREWPASPELRDAFGHACIARVKATYPNPEFDSPAGMGKGTAIHFFERLLKKPELASCKPEMA